MRGEVLAVQSRWVVEDAIEGVEGVRYEANEAALYAGEQDLVRLQAVIDASEVLLEALRELLATFPES
jgi:hypothetical protein